MDRRGGAADRQPRRLGDPQRLAAFSPPVGASGGTGATPRGAIQRELGTAELAAIVFYNRGVDCVERRSYPEAISCNFKARVSAGSPTGTPSR